MARIRGSSVFSTVAALLPIRTKSLRVVRSKGLLTSTVCVEERGRERGRRVKEGREGGERERERDSKQSD